MDEDMRAGHRFRNAHFGSGGQPRNLRFVLPGGIIWALTISLLFLAACGTTAPSAPADDPIQVLENDLPDVAETLETEGEALWPSLVDLDTVRAGRFDDGKMWTFDNPPLNYFEEAYDFRPGPEWLERAKLGALRFADYCSASFVSETGLVLTNHHCARESITSVSDPNENLLDEGFYAPERLDERLVDDLYVEQLIEIRDITDEVVAALETLQTDEERLFGRAEAIEEMEERLTGALGGEEEGYRVQVVSLYSGGRYSAYTYRRYNDVRLVMAPELQMGHFGGDPDNFTYPRYSVDFAFFRVYDNDNSPLETPDHFELSPAGAADGEVVFVVGSPGSTSRSLTYAQLEHERDHELPLNLRILENRIEIFRKFQDRDLERAEELGVRNLVFSLENAIKAYRGQWEGLYDPVLMTRRRDAESRLIDGIRADPELEDTYGRVINDLADLQREKAELTPLLGAYAINPTIGSVVLARGLYGYLYAAQMSMGASEDMLSDLRNEITGFDDRPAELEVELIAGHLRDMLHYLGDNDRTVQAILGDRTPERAADEMVANTALLDSASYVRQLGPQLLEAGDPAIAFGETVLQEIAVLQRDMGMFESREEILNAELARARFEVFGTAFPPDATFSLRLADGIVKGYPYNGTLAPPFTTFYGMYERHAAFGGAYPWNLPTRWEDGAGELRMSTPVNLVSTNDITGGNSGSPLLNRDLEVVGVVFDGNIESLPGEYIYTEERARTVSVDIRGILESLRIIYGAESLMEELGAEFTEDTELSVTD